MMQSARFLIVNLPRLIVHIEPFTIKEENDRSQNKNTMPGGERGRWEENLQLPTIVRTI